MGPMTHITMCLRLLVITILNYSSFVLKTTNLVLCRSVAPVMNQLARCDLVTKNERMVFTSQCQTQVYILFYGSLVDNYKRD